MPRRTAATTKSPSSSPKPRRANTYTGCWTCRRRHYKCDLTRPACKRCTKSKLECAGYEYYLPSNTSGSEFSFRSSRRSFVDGSGTQPVLPTFSPTRLHQVLEDIEVAAEQRKSLESGPFSILAFDIADSASEQETPPQTTVSAHEIYEILESTSAVIEQGEGFEIFDTDDNDESLSPSGLSAPWEHHQLPDLISLSIYSVQYAPAIPRQDQELLHHWITFLCHEMVPLDSSNNIFREIYPMIALANSFDGPLAHSSLVHAICATSSAHLSNLRGRDNKHEITAMEYQQRALSCLRKKLVPNGNPQSPVIIATVLALIAGEAISGRTQVWRSHLAGGLRFVLECAGRSTRDTIMTKLLNQYILTTVLTNTGSPAQMRSLLALIPVDDVYRERCHGITRAMLEILIDIHDFNTTGGGIGSATSTDMAVRLTLLHSKRFLSDSTQDSISSIWYHAIAIFYFRTVLHVDSSAIQSHVAEAITQLETVEALTSGRSGSMLIWPLLTIGTECSSSSTQQRFRVWCHGQRRHAMGNVDRVHDIAEMCWAYRLSKPVSEIQEFWTNLIKGSIYDVMPL